MSQIQQLKQNKTILVTGGAKGIGEAVTRMLCDEGYSVAVNYNNSKENAERLTNELRNNGCNVQCYKADISSSAEVKAMFSEINRTLGAVWGLVNNAGISHRGLLMDVSDEQWHSVLDTDLTGPFYCIREALPEMVKNKSGKIINIASMWGEVGASVEVPYSAAKAGLIGLTKALAKEMGLSGITVNAVSPGVIMTDMMSSFSKEEVDTLKEETPLNTLGKPEDVASAVAYLLSEKADFITGQVLSVNGGFVIT